MKENTDKNKIDYNFLLKSSDISPINKINHNHIDNIENNYGI